MKTFIQKKAMCMLMLTMVMLSLGILTSCDSMVYDYEGDCSVTYRLKFRYDMNLKWADAFANEVKSVNVYAFDEKGVLVWQKAERGAALASADYAMTLDLPAGKYQLIAWCGLDNEGGKQSFSVPVMTVGTSRMEELQCALKRNRATTGEAYSNEMLDFLFHGTLNVDLPSNDDGGSYEYTMPLTKDTNHVRIILQHLSGQNVNVDDFTFRIEDENGMMNYDNSLKEDENITYHAWKTQSGTAGVIIGNETVNCTTAIADITVARMTTDHARKMVLTIARKNGEVVARVPVIDYALLAKDYYEEAYGHKMSDQEFLDREDEYEMTFFLDERDNWLSSYIMIHSWRVVLNNVDLD